MHGEFMELWIDVGEVAVLQYFHCGTLVALSMQYHSYIFRYKLSTILQTLVHFITINSIHIISFLMDSSIKTQVMKSRVK